MQRIDRRHFLAAVAIAPAAVGGSALAQGADTPNVTLVKSLYTAFGDGYGFEPKTPEKLSLGFARVSGAPSDFTGVNIRSTTGEQKGEGARGKKASGILMVEGVSIVPTGDA